MADERDGLTAAGEAVEAITAQMLRVLDARWSKQSKRDWVTGVLRHDLNAALTAALRAGAAHDEGLREAEVDAAVLHILNDSGSYDSMEAVRDAVVALVRQADAVATARLLRLASSPEPVPSEPDAG